MSCKPDIKCLLHRLKHNQLAGKYIIIWDKGYNNGPFYIVNHKVFCTGKIGGPKSLITYKHDKDDTEEHKKIFYYGSYAIIQEEPNSTTKNTETKEEITKPDVKEDINDT
jgi:hypothetical protein